MTLEVCPEPGNLEVPLTGKAGTIWLGSSGGWMEALIWDVPNLRCLTSLGFSPLKLFLHHFLPQRHPSPGFWCDTRCPPGEVSVFPGKMGTGNLFNQRVPF